MRLACFEGEPQRFAGSDEMRLAYDIVEPPRSQRFGKRWRRSALCKKVIHG